MSQIKAYNPEIALVVGIQASLLLNHIKYWVEEYNLEKVYRTNQQISEDFKGTLSESQVQRAKKKLVDNGFVVVSHDKGHTRTTHYTLTEKAKSLLGMISGVVKKVVKAVKEKVAPKKQVKSDKPKSMSESFKEYGDTSHAVAIPENLKSKLSGLLKKKEEIVEVEEEQLDDEEYFKSLDASMAICKQKELEPELSFSELMGKAFNQVPNIEQFEKNRMALEQARNFKEDY